MKGGFITILATAMACVVVACGDDDAADTTERASGVDAASDTKDRASGADAASDTKDRASGADAASDTTAPSSTGRFAVNPTTADGVTPADGPEKMLGDFGRPPTRAERAAIAAVIDRYHAAVAADDDARACAQMSRAARRAIGQNVAGGPPKRCVDQLDIFHSGHSDAIREVLPDARITELRVEGRRAIAIAVMPGPRTLKLPLERERGTWRYTTFGKWTPPSL